MARVETPGWLELMVVATAAVVLAGCGSVSTSASGGSASSGKGASRMMGGSSAGDGTGGDAGYHFGQLSCSVPRPLPGRTVRVTLGDMGMTQMVGGTAPLGVRMMLRTDFTTAPAGKVSLVASNLGWRTHELVVLPLAAGAVAGARVPGSDGKVSEHGSLGEASHTCGEGAGTGIAAGTVSWVTLTVPAGHYELVCNLPNHYTDGMYAELIVT